MAPNIGEGDTRGDCTLLWGDGPGEGRKAAQKRALSTLVAAVPMPRHTELYHGTPSIVYSCLPQQVAGALQGPGEQLHWPCPLGGSNASLAALGTGVTPGSLPQ